MGNYASCIIDAFCSFDIGDITSCLRSQSRPTDLKCVIRHQLKALHRGPRTRMGSSLSVHHLSIFAWKSAIHAWTNVTSSRCVCATGTGGKLAVVSLGNKPFSSQWWTAPEIRIKGLSVVLVRGFASGACGVTGRHGSTSPSMNARRS